MSIAIIPARGGSKRIPRKNIKLFNGIPMIAYSIKCAEESGIFRRIIVSTDDMEIANIARKHGAEVPWIRSSSLADDFSSTSSVIQDAVIRSKSDFEGVANVCCIYPAVPLLNPSFLVEGLRVLQEGSWDFVFSALQNKTHPQRVFKLDENRGVAVDPSSIFTKRTQDLPLTYHDAGQFYWGKKASWETGKPIFGINSTIVEMPSNSVVDIDEPSDWNAALELYLRNQKD
jgi:pseudaminic acid cytidylyltransferase